MTIGEIAPVILEELPQVLEIEAKSFAYPWEKALFVEEFNNPQAFLFAVKIKNSEHKDRIGAYICIRASIAEIEILKIAVALPYRGRGLAQELIKWCEKLGRQKNVENIFLEVRPSNQAAINLYQKMGYSLVAKRPLYYPETGEDALIMQKKLKE